MYPFHNLEPVCCSVSSSNCCFLTCIQVSQEAGQVVWCSHLFQNFPQFVVIHTVKGFGIKPLNKSEVDVCFYYCYFGEGNGNRLRYSCLANPMDGGAWWAAVHGVAMTRLSDFTFTFHFHALKKEMATHSSVLAWRIPGMGDPGGLSSLGLHRVGHDWSDLATATSICAQGIESQKVPQGWRGKGGSLFQSCSQFCQFPSRGSHQDKFPMGPQTLYCT